MPSVLMVENVSRLAAFVLAPCLDLASGHCCPRCERIPYLVLRSLNIASQVLTTYRYPAQRPSHFHGRSLTFVQPWVELRLLGLYAVCVLSPNFAEQIMKLADGTMSRPSGCTTNDRPFRATRTTRISAPKQLRRPATIASKIVLDS